jgi:ribosomal protein L17
MDSTLAFARNEAFDPEAVRVMSQALDAAWKELTEMGHVSTAPFKAKETQEMLAKRIITIARRGERDPARLCLAALIPMNLDRLRNSA